MTLVVPDRLVRAILFVRGEDDGRAWLRVLPRRVDHYLRVWKLTSLEVAEGGAMSCCLFCQTEDGTQAVLKIPFDAGSGRLESRSLERWGPAGVSPTVLESAPSSGVFLMSRVLPGTVAQPTGAPEDSVRLLELMERMLCPELGPMRGLKRIDDVIRLRFEWAYDRFADPGYERQTSLMPGVEELFAALQRSDDTVSVVHGDLQQKNILIGSGGGWQLIDPMTCRGDIGADAALWAIVQEGDATIEQRVGELAASGLLERSRLEAWCYVIGVAEYRTYQPGMAARIAQFVDRRDWRDLAAAISAPPVRKLRR